MGYRFVTHEEVPRLAEQLAELSNIAFAEYEGAPAVDADFIRWYLQRPGCTPQLCGAALYGDKLVSNVLVALQKINIGGEYVLCGIIDTVATHPEHRRRGLARRLMEMAHERMQAEGAEAAVLYTNPAHHPYQFYQRLGYVTRAQAALLTGPRPRACPVYIVRPLLPEEVVAGRELVMAKYARYEGFAQLEENLWRWHREERPASLPALFVGAFRAEQLVGAAALAAASVLLTGQQQPVTVVSDIVYESQECLRALLAAAPCETLMALCDVQAPEHEALQQLGLNSALGEVAMACPFTERARELLRRPPLYWYVMVESVVGV